MKTYPNGMSVPYGLYFSSNPFDLRFVGAEGERLEGREGARYKAIPPVLALLASPVIGGAFVVAFPVIIASTLFLAAAEALNRAVAPVAERQAPLVRMRMVPTAAYLNPASEDEVSGEQETDEELETLKARADEAKETEDGER